MIQSYTHVGQGSPEYTKGIKRNAWIIATEPTSDELDELAAELGVARDLLQDSQDPNEVPRIQPEGGVVYVFIRMPEYRDERMVTVPVLLAMGQDFFLTVWDTEPTFMEKFIGGQEPYSTEQRSQLLMKILGQVNSMYQGSITEISRSVRATMADLGKVANKDILSLVSFEGILNDFLGALVAMHTHLGGLMSGKHIKTYVEDEDLYEDVLLQSGQIIETCKSVLKTTGNYRNAYTVIVNNNLNAIVKFLTAATVVLAVPTAIFSFYGMNVQLPLDGSPGAWLVILSITAILGAALVALFSRNRWL